MKKLWPCIYEMHPKQSLNFQKKQTQSHKAKPNEEKHIKYGEFTLE